MDKKKILEAARKNRERGKEFEKEEISRSNAIGLGITMLIAGGLLLFELFIKGTFNWGIAALGLTAMGVQSLLEGIKLRRLPITMVGIVASVMALFAILIFVWQVIVQ